MESKTYIKELDGLRGFAVLLVMAYHFSHVNSSTNNVVDNTFTNLVRMGWMGVDIFFVLSGFLITRILLWSKDTDLKNYLKVFYIKRSLRIFPLYFAYLIFIFAIFYPLIGPTLGAIEQHKIQVAQDSAVWFFLYVSNIKQALNGVFFGAGLGHLWSLSIEEQFYIFWPFVIYFVKTKHLKNVFLSLIVLSLLLRIVMYLNGVSGEIIYVFTFTRIDGLIFGAYVALLTVTSGTAPISILKAKYVFYVLLVVNMVVLYVLGPRVESHPVIYTILLSTMGLSFALLIWILQSNEKSTLKVIFSNKMLIYFGKYSYGLYMFHPLLRQFIMKVIGQPKLIMGSQMIWEIGVIIICTIVSLLFALLSWNLFEKWFLKSKGFFLKSPIVAKSTVN